MSDTDPLPPIRTDPRYGCFPRWPEDGDAWVHPEDVTLARQLIPSPRIWRLDEGEDPTDGKPVRTISYGKLRLRVAPAMWQPMPEPAFTLGDWVEVRTADHQHEPHTGQVREVEWDAYSSEIVYLLTERGQPLPSYYRAEELVAVEPPTGEPEPVVDAPRPEDLDGVADLVEGLEVDEHNKRENWW